jgi:hypothetical protein
LASFGTKALAWGCDGHQAVAMLAERMLGSATAAKVRAVLVASPIAPELPRFCGAIPSDVIADASTWADDFREIEPSTAGWHFVNYPRAIGGQTGNHLPFCVQGNCAIDAITRQFVVLRTSADKRRKANALRFLIHIVGDIHQPLHTVTNGDRGGNCLPVSYFSQSTQRGQNGSFSPNLHRVWDNDLIRTLMSAHSLTDARALADHVASIGLPQTVAAQDATTARVRSWARGTNELARSVAYGRLAVNPPMEPATALFFSSCADNNHVSERMAALHEVIGNTYQQASAPVILAQLRLASIRLAAVLKAALP